MVIKRTYRGRMNGALMIIQWTKVLCHGGSDNEETIRPTRCVTFEDAPKGLHGITCSNSVKLELPVSFEQKGDRQFKFFYDAEFKMLGLSYIIAIRSNKMMI